MSNSKSLRSLAIIAALLGGMTARPLWSAETSRPGPSANEIKILAALDEKTELEFADQPLTDVIEYLKERHDIEIQLDIKALTDEGIGSDTPVTRNIKGIRLEAALDLILGELEMTYLVRDDVMYLTTKAKAENLLSVRIYPVADLIVRADDPGHEDDYQSLSALITASVAPHSWNHADGPGSILEFSNARALVISQTFAVHREIEGLLAAIREVRQQQAVERPSQAAQPIDDKTPYVKVYRLPEPAATAAAKTSLAVDAAVSPATPDDAPRAGAAPADAKAGQQPASKARHLQPQSVAAAAKAPYYATAQELAEAISASISPESWTEGRTAIHAAGHSLIVRQTRPVHREIARLLAQLR